MSGQQGGERVRLFVALELPGAVRDEVVAWCRRALRDSEGLRPLASAALHVTLCFLGWRWESELDAIAGACELLAGTRAMRLKLGEPVWLPPRRPRVLAVELLDASGGLREVQSQLSATLCAGGWYTPEIRPFLAHVTVARARREARLRAVDLSPPEGLEFDGSEVVLYRSRLGAGGARYEPLHRVVLGVP